VAEINIKDFGPDLREGVAEKKRKQLAGRAKQASSLVEMLIAIFVLAVVIMSMVGMFFISQTAIYNKEDETANALALRYLEELEVRPFASLTSGYTETRTPRFSPKYDASALVVDRDAYSATVSVTVKWDAATLGSRNITLERVISATGHQNVGELP